MLKKVQLGFVYVLIIIIICIYIFGSAMEYQLLMDNQALENEIEKVSEENDQYQIQINSTQSRGVIIEENDELEIRDNIYFLE